MSDFLGVPIEGEISHYSSKKIPTQSDPQVLLDKLQALFDHPLVEAVKWRQYTPYFNDGDACVFSAYGASVRLVGGDDEAGDYEDGFYTPWDIGYYSETKDIPGVEEVRALLRALDDEIESGAHDIILNEKFGDPAEVIATEGGFEVEFYEHD